MTTKAVTARYVVREGDLTGLDWKDRSKIIEDAQRAAQWSIGYQIVQALLAQGDHAHVSLAYAIREEDEGHTVIVTYRAVVG